MKITFLVLLLIAPPSFSATNPFVPHWRTECRAENVKIEFSFDSKSGEADSDDMEIAMTTGGKKQKINIKEGLFQPLQLDSESKCDKLPAMITDDELLLVLFGINDRPLPTKIAAIVVDPKNQRVAQLNENIAQEWGNVSVGNGAITVSAIQAWKKVQKSDGPENVFGGKLKISFKKGKITKEWMTKIPPGYR
jgi:hypothetical protein